ncbi:MAG TPA: hypothetical protein VI409_03080, partial [Gaiellaceae bacterium]|nr:hypothetical protein [Gaiellaceae bacterium]HLG07637.1 hypothetical protein [Gaiellaceae bacterium]
AEVRAGQTTSTRARRPAAARSISEVSPADASVSFARTRIHHSSGPPARAGAVLIERRARLGLR